MIEGNFNFIQTGEQNLQSKMLSSVFSAALGRRGAFAATRAQLRLLHGASICMDGVRQPDLGLPADVDAASLKGMRHQSPHQLEIEWSDARSQKWGVAVQPNGARHVDVSDRVDISVPGKTFAKMKCVKDYEGNIRLFRPEAALDRFQEQCKHKGLPGFDQDELLECIFSLLKVDSAWIPDAYGYSMDVALETKAGSSLENGRLVCVLNPRAPRNRWAYTATVPGNGASAGADVKENPYNIMLDRHLFQSADESSDALFMLVDKDGSGKKELITAPVDPARSGVLRSTVLQLAEQHGDMVVTEEVVSMEDVLSYVKSKRVAEMFCTVSQGIHPVMAIEHTGGLDHVSSVVSLATMFDAEISEIEYGRHENSEAWTTVVKPSS